MDPDVATPPRQSDRPPVGVPLVSSRRNPDGQPARAVDDPTTGAERRAEVGFDDAVPVEPGAFVGRVALVTSATGVLAGALVAELLARGARVLLVDDDLQLLLTAVDELEAWDRAVPLRCDLASSDDVGALCRFVVAATTVDVIVHVSAAAASGEGVASGEGDDRAVRGLDRQLGERIRGPAELVDGLASSLPPGARMVVVEPWPVPLGSRSTPEDLLVDHLCGSHGLRPGRATCGRGVAPELFAATLLDLVGADDVPFDRLVLDAGADVVSEPVGDSA